VAKMMLNGCCQSKEPQHCSLVCASARTGGFAAQDAWSGFRRRRQHAYLVREKRRMQKVDVRLRAGAGVQTGSC